MITRKLLSRCKVRNFTWTRYSPRHPIDTRFRLTLLISNDNASTRFHGGRDDRVKIFDEVVMLPICDVGVRYNRIMKEAIEYAL